MQQARAHLPGLRDQNQAHRKQWPQLQSRHDLPADPGDFNTSIGRLSRIPPSSRSPVRRKMNGNPADPSAPEPICESGEAGSRSRPSQIDANQRARLEPGEVAHQTATFESPPPPAHCRALYSSRPRRRSAFCPTAVASQAETLPRSQDFRDQEESSNSVLPIVAQRPRRCSTNAGMFALPRKQCCCDGTGRCPRRVTLISLSFLIFLLLLVSSSSSSRSRRASNDRESASNRALLRLERQSASSIGGGRGRMTWNDLAIEWRKPSKILNCLIRNLISSPNAIALPA